MAIGVLLSSFPYVGLPVLNATFGFFQAPSSVQIQRLQITAQTVPVGGNITVALVNQSGTAYSGATVTLGAAVPYYDQALAAPITLSPGQIVRAKITAVDGGVASDLTVNLIGATGQGSTAPSGCCPPSECQQPTAQLLFFQGSVVQEQAAAAASAAAAALSATAANTSAVAAAASASAASASATAAAASATDAAAQVTQASLWATNANNARLAAEVFANQAEASAIEAAASATAAAAGIPGALLVLSAGSVQTIADATPTAASWSTVQYDDLSFWSAGNPTRITIPADVTRVRLSAGIRWTANGTGERKLKIRSNPAGTYEADSIWASDDRPSDDTGDATIVTPPINVVEGMYFELIVEQDSTGALDINTTGAANNRSNFFCVEVLKRS